MQAAVPKSFQLQMLPPSGSVLLPGGQITQEMRVKNNSPSVSQVTTCWGLKKLINFLLQAVLRMKLRISYNCNGNPITEQTEVSNFPDV